MAEGANTTQFSPIRFFIKYNGETKEYDSFKYDTYLSVIMKKAFLDFNIPEEDLRKYELRLNDKPLIKSARLFNIQAGVQDGCTFVLALK